MKSRKRCKTETYNL